MSILVSSLFSCGTYRDFSKQKYTGLKKIETTYEASPSERDQPTPSLNDYFEPNDEHIVEYNEWDNFDSTSSETDFTSNSSEIADNEGVEESLTIKQSQCKDTIILLSEELLIGKITQVNKRKILYTSCGESEYERAIRTSQVEKISQEGKTLLINDKKDLKPKYKKVRKTAGILMIIGLATIVSIATPFGIIAIVPLVVGIIMWLISMDMKRKYQKKNDPEFSPKKGAASIFWQIIGWIAAGFVTGGSIMFWLLIGLDL